MKNKYEFYYYLIELWLHCIITTCYILIQYIYELRCFLCLCMIFFNIVDWETNIFLQIF